MTCSQLIEKYGLEVLNLADGDREITGCYTGDLLSWVMSRAKAGDCWITIMTNLNIVAVASLVDTACILVGESAELDSAVIEKAAAQDINLFRSAKPSYELCCDIFKALGK